MGCLCSSPPDLTEQHYQVADWEDIMGPQSVWIGTANLHNNETDYIEISIISKLDNPLKGRRVINIAEGTSSDSTRFEFAIEPVPKKKRKKDGPSHMVVFYWEDPSGLTLRGVDLNEDKLRIRGLATLVDKERNKTFTGPFAIARAVAPARTHGLSPRVRNPSSQSTKALVLNSTEIANKKYESEELTRKSKIDQKAVRAVAQSKEFSSAENLDTEEDSGDSSGGKRTPGLRRNRLQSAV